MKKIHLIRHAKSSWEDSLLSDVQRPLNKRGIRTCQLMASHIYAAGCHFSNVFCSPAVRAHSTIERLNQHLPNVDVQWQTDDALYTFDSERLHQFCRTLSDSVTDVVIVGHNPALTDFCNELSSANIKNLPTCGYVQLLANNDCDWLHMSEMDFELIQFLKPKKMMRSMGIDLDMS